MLELRAALVIALATGLTSAVCQGLGLSGSAVAYGAVIAALIVRPDFQLWPTLLYPVLLGVVGLCMGLGVAVGQGLADVPQVLVFGLVAALMQLLSLLLPTKLRLLSGAMAVAGVLPLLSASPSWSDWGKEMLALALGMAIGTLLQLLFTPASQSNGSQPEGESEEGAATAAQASEPPLAVRCSRGCAHPSSGASSCSPAWRWPLVRGWEPSPRNTSISAWCCCSTTASAPPWRGCATGWWASASGF